MKIALVHNTYLEQGGEDVVFWQERDLLRAGGNEVFEFQRFNREMENYSTAQRITLIGRTVWARDSYDAFRSLLGEKRPDVVHVHNTFPLISPSILWACREANVPVVHTLHNYRLLCPGANFIRDGKPCEDCTRGTLWPSVLHGCYRGSRPQTAVVALMLTVHRNRETWTNMVDRYIVLTEFARRRFVSAGLPAEKITVKPNCVDPDPGMKTGAGSYALFVGRISEEKGTPTLLKAWRQLPRTFSLRVIGDGPARAQLESEAKAAGLSNVMFLGRLGRDQVMAAMKEARFLIFPSQLYENLPLTIIESFACGVPVLASRLGAMQEIVDEGRTGRFFQAGNPDDLARVAARAWKQADHMDRLGHQARAEYESKYTAARSYRQLLEIYGQVIVERAGDAGDVPMKESQEVSSIG
jgi:glycosyltransferase involved in cell wall biosynthesis